MATSILPESEALPQSSRLEGVEVVIFTFVFVLCGDRQASGCEQRSVSFCTKGYGFLIRHGYPIWLS